MIYVNPADHREAANAAILKALNLSAMLKWIKAEIAWLTANKEIAKLPATDEQVSAYHRRIHEEADRMKLIEQSDEAAQEFMKAAWLRSPIHKDPELLKEWSTRLSGFLARVKTLPAEFDTLKKLMKNLSSGGRWDSLALDMLLSDPDEDSVMEDDDLDRAIACVNEAHSMADKEKTVILAGSQNDDAEAPDTSDWPTQAKVAQSTQLSEPTVSRAVSTGLLVSREGKIDPASIGPWLLSRASTTENDRPLERAKQKTTWYCEQHDMQLAASVDPPICTKCKNSKHVKRGRIDADRL